MTRLKFVVGILALLIGAGAMSHAQGVDGDTRLGTWLVAVTPPAASGRPAFNTFITFAGGGAFIATTQNESLMPNAGTQLGTWRRGADGTIRSTQLYFVFGPNGVALGTVKVRAAYEFSDADNLTGSGQLLLCDLAASNCKPLPGLATLQGEKVEVEDIVGP